MNSLSLQETLTGCLPLRTSLNSGATNLFRWMSKRGSQSNADKTKKQNTLEGNSSANADLIVCQIWL